MIMDGIETLPQINSLDLSAAYICEILRNLSSNTAAGDSRCTGAVPSEELETGDDPSSFMSFFFSDPELKSGKWFNF